MFHRSIYVNKEKKTHEKFTSRETTTLSRTQKSMGHPVYLQGTAQIYARAYCITAVHNLTNPPRDNTNPSPPSDSGVRDSSCGTKITSVRLKKKKFTNTSHDTNRGLQINYKNAA